MTTTLTARDGRSVLVLTHTFDDRAGAASFAAGWDACIAALDGTGPVDHRTRHERYVEQLGLLAPAVTGTAERWEVRVERQLVQPAEVVRAVLDGLPGRWELVEGTGHGARLRHVRTGSGAAGRDRAVRELPAAVTALADRLADRP